MHNTATNSKRAGDRERERAVPNEPKARERVRRRQQC